MTIAQEFNKLAVAHGGTADSSGTIAGAIDALNDALAGSDQPAAQTIEEAVKRLGEHIGGGSASGTIEITENGEGIDVAQYAYADVNVSGGGAQSGYVYILEYADGAVSLEKPWGKVYVGENEVQSTTTLDVAMDGNQVTSYGYEIPFGSVAKYQPSAAVMADYPGLSDNVIIFPSPQDAGSAEGDILCEAIFNPRGEFLVVPPTTSSIPFVVFVGYAGSI